MLRQLWQFVKFGIVGGSMFLLDFGLMVLFTEVLGWYYLYASICSFSLATAVNYLLSTRWVFQVQEGRNAPLQFSLFMLLALSSLALNTLFLWVFSKPVGLHYMPSKWIAGALGGIYNFVTRKILLER